MEAMAQSCTHQRQHGAPHRFHEVGAAATTHRTLGGAASTTAPATTPYGVVARDERSRLHCVAALR